MVSAAPAWPAWPATPATARAPQRVALCPSGEDTGTGSRGGGRPSRCVWRRTRHRHTLGLTTNERDHQYQLCRTRESGASPTQSSTDAQDQCVQQRAALVGETAVVVAGIHAFGFSP